MKVFFSILLTGLFSFSVSAQVGIGTETPQATSAMDITSTTKGFLMPRMTTVQREAIIPSQNAKGLQVYDTTENSIWISDGVVWKDTKNKFVDGTDPLNAVFVDGNVGIGTSTPSEKLEVIGTVRASYSATSTTSGYVDLTSNSSNNSGWVDFYNWDGAAFDRAGYIGYANDDSIKYVTYDLRNHSFTGGNIITDSNVIANGVTLTSDKRLKKNINSLDSGLEDLLKIQTKTYNWKDESKPTNLQIGVIAQQLETVFPELVDNSQEYKSVNYMGLIPVMIEAIRDLDTENKALEAENTELKAMMKKLAKRVSALEK